MSNKTQPSNLAIVGGGISGLTAAYYAIKQGQDPAHIHIYESTGRTGGKVETRFLGNTPVNNGPEFIDSTHRRLIEMAQELGVPLVPTAEQDNEIFTRINGKAMSGAAFHSEYRPMQLEIARMKKELAINPKGEIAQQLNRMSMEELLTKLGATVEKTPDRPWYKILFDAVMLNNNHVSAEIPVIAAHAYASECGQPSANISALQFVNEVSDVPGSFLKSDCAYRVEGGTEHLIEALRAKLEAQGVQFHTNSKVSAIGKVSEHELNLKILQEGQDEQTVKHSKVILALPAYALAKIDGLEALGLSHADQKLITHTQYTDNVKFTVRIDPSIKIPQGNFFSNEEYQCWSSSPDTMTFLVNKGGREPNAKALITRCMTSYAEANNIDAGKLFAPITPENVVFNNPGRTPCYATPKPGQSLALENLGHSLDHLAANGVGVAGTFLPLRNADNSLSFGFMEGGLASAQIAAENLLSQSQERTRWRDMMRDHDRSMATQPGQPAEKRSTGAGFRL